MTSRAARTMIVVCLILAMLIASAWYFGEWLAVDMHELSARDGPARPA